MSHLEQTIIGTKEDEQTSLPLGQIREQITALDAELLSLFSKRRALSCSVARNKKQSKKPIRDQEREKILLERLVKQGALSGLNSSYITRLFNIIIEDSVNQQQDFLQSISNPDYEPTSNKSLAVLGGKGAYSYLAAKKYFSNSHNTYLGCNTFEKVLKSISDGKAEYGVIPIENTTSGGITEVYDLLLDSDLTIIGEEKYAIKHCLVAAPGAQLRDIKKILGHPEASRQCNKNLRKLVEAEVNLVSSTAEALELVAQGNDKSIAAIASEEAAELFGLKILLNGIANQKNNTTRFLIVALKPKKVSLQVTSKTSLALSTGQKPGSLAEVLLIFRDADVPLSKLESRPVPDKPWEQMFYLDIEANITDKKVEQALDDVSKLCRYVKVLGCYPTKDVSSTKISANALAKANVSNPIETSSMPIASEAKDTTKKAVKRKSYHLASREYKAEDTIIEVKGAKLGGDTFSVIGGPCSVESYDQIMSCAKHASETGVSILRGGCFKPRTSPYSFQGLEYKGLDYMQEAGDKYGLPIVTEVMKTEDMKAVAKQADMLQIGARNMQNFSLLKAAGQINRPIMLKRGLMSSIDELLNAAEYILAQGNKQVFLCERGIRTFETATRNTLDLSAVPILKQLTHLPIIVDPSHAVGKRELVLPMAKAAKAVGAHGIMVEFHPKPEEALSDGPQSLRYPEFAHMMSELYK